MEESGTARAKYSRKVVSGRRVADAIRSLVNARDLQLEYVRVLHVPFLMYGSDKMLWKEKERSRIRAVQMDKLKCLLGIRKMDRVPNARIRELYGLRKGVEEGICEGVLWWCGHV